VSYKQGAINLSKFSARDGQTRKSFQLGRCITGSSFGLLWLMLCLIFSAPSSAAPAVKNTTKTESVIELKAKTSMFGNVTFLIAPKKVVINCFTGSSIWNSCKPEQVQLVHPEGRCYFNIATNDWVNRKRNGIDRVSIVRVTKLGEERLANQTCMHYLGYSSKDDSKAVPSIEFWSIPKPPCDKETIEFLCKFFCLPSQYGLPIKVKQLQAGVFGTMMTPLSCETKTIGSINFALPQGYRQVKDLGSLYFAERGGSLEASDLDNYFGSDRSDRSNR
jgi:hypothetical protein